VTREGVASPVDSGMTGDFQTLALSPDGRRLALGKVDSADHQVWVKQLPRGRSQADLRGQPGYRPTWTPDGPLGGFISNQSQRLRMYRRLADRTAAAELVPTNPDRGVERSLWSRDAGG
jgi:Tol biopolymer transport system component